MCSRRQNGPNSSGRGGDAILRAMVTGVRVHGPFMGPSGYDNHVRQFVRSLSQRGVGVELRDIPDWSPVRLPHHLRDPWYESLSKASTPVGSALHFTLPIRVVPDPALPNVNFTMFEAASIPKSWVAAHPLSDLIVLPTRHSRDAWLKSGVPEEKIRHCPLGVRADLFRPGVRPLALTGGGGRPISSYAVRFLNVSEINIRKNFVGLLAAWLRATTPQDDAVLILKLGSYNPGALSTFDLSMAKAVQRAVKKPANAAPIHVTYELYPDADMPRVFAAATHYISLSFGEGWDLSMIQAAASGLRLIAPRHSAYLEYLNDDIATLVPSREAPAISDDDPWEHEFFIGANWWYPDEDGAVAAIRAAIDGRDAPRASARDHIASQFTWEQATERLVEILDEAEAMAARR